MWGPLRRVGPQNSQGIVGAAHRRALLRTVTLLLIRPQEVQDRGLECSAGIPVNRGTLWDRAVVLHVGNDHLDVTIDLGARHADTQAWGALRLWLPFVLSLLGTLTCCLFLCSECVCALSLTITHVKI